MPIQNVVINAVDVQRSVDFYTRFLDAEFRHIGFKVDRVDPRAEVLRRAGTRFHLDPMDAEGGVRICYFFDRNGTLLELVEGDLQYASIVDPEGVAREPALGVPSRPRFDDTVIEVFTCQSVKLDRRPQLDTPGFSHTHLGPGNIDGLSALGADDAGVLVDPDGFPFTAVRSTGPQS